MSFQAMTWAVEQKTASAGQKLVLLMLANYCNGHTGQCNPSHKRLAEECCMGVSTLKGHLQALEASGHLKIISKAVDGVSLPNQYMLNLEGVGQNLAGGGSESGRGVGQNLATNQEFKPGKEPDVQRFAPACPYQAIVDAYHEKLPDLPRCILINEKRKTAARKFWKWVLTSVKSDGTRRAETEDQALLWIQTYFSRASANEFLMGRRNKPGPHENWIADFDYLLTDRGMKQVIERTVA